MAKQDYFKAYDKSQEKIKETIFGFIVVLVIVVIALVFYKMYKAAKVASTVVGDTLGSAIISQQTGIPVSRLNTCKDVAEKTHMAMHGDGGWLKIPGVSDSLTEDEPAVISNLNRLLSASEAKYVSQQYSTFWGARNLKDDVAKYLDASERGQINSVILNNLT